MNVTFGRNRSSLLGDISYDEMAKRAGEFKRLVPRDFSGFGNKAKEMVDSPSWYANIVRLRQPHTIGAVNAQSTNEQNLEVIIHNITLWKNWLNAYLGLAISHQSTRVAVWKIGAAREALRGYRTQYNTEADTILNLAREYITAIGIQRNQAVTPNVTENVILDPAGNIVGKTLTRSGSGFVSLPKYSMTKDGNIAMTSGNESQLNPMFIVLPLAAVGAYLALKH